MRTERLYVGPYTLAFIALAPMITAGIVWLDVGGMSALVLSAFTVLYIPGAVMLLMCFVLAKRSSVGVSHARGDNMWMVVAVGLFANFIAAMLVLLILGTGNIFPQFAVVGTVETALIAILFAMYEETQALGVAGLLKMAGIPDIVILLLSAAWFLLMHALAYSTAITITIDLIVARVIFTATVLSTDNTDAGFWTHILWNLGAVL